MFRTPALLTTVLASTALVSAAALTATAAQAQTTDLVAYQGTNAIRLTEAACTDDAVLQQLAPELRPYFRSAWAQVEGKRYNACWGTLPTAVILVYEDGDQGLVPLSDLRVPMDI